MSILVKGMKKPKNCDECPLADSYLACGAQSINCPLIEVRTPHGRLIDADALKVKFTKTDANGINLELDRYALKCIETAPTIIEAEEGDKNE